MFPHLHKNTLPQKIYIVSFKSRNLVILWATELYMWTLKGKKKSSNIASEIKYLQDLSTMALCLFCML